MNGQSPRTLTISASNPASGKLALKIPAVRSALPSLRIRGFLCEFFMQNAKIEVVKFSLLQKRRFAIKFYKERGPANTGALLGRWIKDPKIDEGCFDLLQASFSSVGLQSLHH